MGKVHRLARRALGDDMPCLRVPLGAEPFDTTVAAPWSDAAQAAYGERGFDVAVIGAIGAHKGLDALEALPDWLPPTVRVVVIGYTGHQLGQGWAAGGRIWVHGVFDPDALPQLVRQYGARLALFPPGMPESHCYALSDAWMSGLAALAPDHGALAERIRRHGGGSLYDPQATPQQLAGLLADALASARRHDGALPLNEPLPTMEAMMATMNRLYGQLPVAGPASPAADNGLQALAQQHLDSRFMRREITDLQRDLDALRQQLAQAQSDSEQHRQHYLQLRARLQRLVGWLPAGVQQRAAAVAKRWLR